MAWYQYIWAPGIWGNPAVYTAWTAGTLVALASGAVGVFVVMRGQSFTGHALGDVGTTGAAGAFLAGIGALWGFLAAGAVTGGAVEWLGRRVRERDIATGVVMAFMLGLAALFLYLVSIYTNASNAPMTILFGSLFTVSPSLQPALVVLSVAALAILALIYRPLLFSTATPEVARSRGIPVRLVGLAFMLALVIAAEEAALAVGAILSTALLIGPAATAARAARRPATAVLLGAGLAVANIWLGILLAYDSYWWPPVHTGWPVSFFVTLLSLLMYGVGGLLQRGRRMRALPVPQEGGR